MITMPEDLNDFILSSFSETKFKRFNDVNKEYLMINKKPESSKNTEYNCNISLYRETEFPQWFEFYNIKTSKGVYPFDLNILDNGKLKKINGIFFGKISYKYYALKVDISFTIKKNYDIIT